MAIYDEIKEQNKKFKDMTFSAKINYISTYYKWPIIVAVVIIIGIISTVKVVVNNSRPVYLEAIFLNSPRSSGDYKCSLEDDFLSACGIDASKYNTGFDYVTTLDSNYEDGASYAGQVKLMGKFSSQTLDVLCGQESVLKALSEEGGFYDLSSLLSKDELQKLEDKGYELYYSENKSYPVGIYIDKCTKLVGSTSSCVYDVSGEDRLVLTVAWNSNNLEHVIDFINFVTE